MMNKRFLRTFGAGIFIGLLCENKRLFMTIYMIDIETTGLELHSRILEITIRRLNGFEFADDGVNVVIESQPNHWVGISPVVMEMHTNSGLKQESLSSDLSMSQAEEILIQYIGDFSGNNYMAGNSIAFDRVFLDKYLPNLSKLFHYRMMDITSFRIYTEHFAPEVHEKYLNYSRDSEIAHRATADLDASLTQLKLYRDELMK